MRPPSVYAVTRPSPHTSMSTTANVQSIVASILCLAGFVSSKRGCTVRAGDRCTYWFYMLRHQSGALRCDRAEFVKALAAEGVPASGDTGESDPLEAIEDALQTFSAERVLLFTHGEGRQRYREEIDPGEVSERFGVPAERIPVS